ncbi:MAG: TolB family protein, partial [Bryobacteraceae bacterium]
MRTFLFLVCAGALVADDAYRKPSQAILDALHTPPTPQISVSPSRDRVLLLQGVRYPPIADLARPMLRLAGRRIDPGTNGPHAPSYYVGLTLKTIAGGAETTVTLPRAPRIAAPEWSPDGKQFAFTQTTDKGIELWAGDAATGRARRLASGINAAYGDAVAWMPDSRRLLVQTIPAGRGPAPREPDAPAGPNIQESSGSAAPVRTYQDLLRSAHDEKLFDYYATTQWMLIDAASGVAAPIGPRGIYQMATPSPDGRHLLVARVVGPYSRLHPATMFPREVEVWEPSGRLEHKLASLPLAEAPIDGVAAGPRQYGWKPTEPATLVWVEALDGGDPRRKAAHRDRVLTLKAPFGGAAAEFTRTEHRLQQIGWLEGEDAALVGDFDRNRRWTRRMLVKGGEVKTLASRNQGDRYRDPGTPVLRTLPSGHRAIRQEEGAIFFEGNGASPSGDRPFLDRLDLASGKTERLFRSAAGGYEEVVALLDGGRFLTRRESRTEPGNYFVRGAGEEARPLTSFKDPAPQLRRIKKERVTYKRADGVQLSFTLYLPPDYKTGTRLPTVVWAYPREYT